MLGLVLRGAAAALKAARSPAVRKAVVEGAKAVGKKAKEVGRSAVQGCKVWQRNRAIRVAYNARKKRLAKDIAAMRAKGAPKSEIMKKAHEFRKGERLRARQEMIKNGDRKLVEKLEKRDLAKYGNKDGPTLEHLQAEARKKLLEKGMQNPSADDVAEHIIDSATRTDVLTNIKFLSF